MGDDEETVRRLQHEWMQAWVDQDAAKLERLLAPEYALVVSSMPDRLVTRDQWMAMLGRYTAQGFRYESMIVRLFGNFAVVSSLGTAEGAEVDGADRSMTFFLTDVWLKSDDQWQVISRSSSVPEQVSPSVTALGRPT